MNARNSNDATWYILRTPRDFTPVDAQAPPAPETPRLGENLFYDDARRVLELLPLAPERELGPLPSLAVDPDGAVYRVDPSTCTLMVRRCPPPAAEPPPPDPTQLAGPCDTPEPTDERPPEPPSPCPEPAERPVVCEPGILAGPRGLALDRRGFLYIADARARRVVVLRPEDGTVRAVLAGLEEPVDVATSAAGRVYVADRGSGQVAVYSARHRHLLSFPARNAEDLPAAPRPVAVMVEADGTVLVADARHPRLLRFTAAGEPLADVPLRTLTAELPSGDVALDALETAYGRRRPRFLVGTCAPPRPRRDGGAHLAEVHRALRLLRLALGRRFAAEGIFRSAALDGGAPGRRWHRVEVDAELPAGASVFVETATSDAVDGLDLTDDSVWSAPRDARGELIPFSTEVPDQLVQSAPGRFLWLRLRLVSDGTATASVRALRVLYPRVSYLDLLPRFYRRDPEGAWFMERFLALFEGIMTRVEDRYEEFSRQLNPAAAPRDVLDWLACLLDLSFDPSWPLPRRRALVLEAMDLFRQRGTPAGLRRYVEIYTGAAVQVREAFLERPRQPAYLGRPGSVLGCPLRLSAGSPQTRPAEQLYREFAHRFTVLVYLEDPCDAEVQMPVIDRIVEINKPAHTEHTICPVYPDARVGVQSTVGLDFVLGAAGSSSTTLGGCREPGEPSTQQPSTQQPSTLGVDSILGAGQPSYVRPLEREL